MSTQLTPSDLSRIGRFNTPFLGVGDCWMTTFHGINADSLQKPGHLLAGAFVERHTWSLAPLAQGRVDNVNSLTGALSLTCDHAILSDDGLTFVLNSSDCPDS